MKNSWRIGRKIPPCLPLKKGGRPTQHFPPLEKGGEGGFQKSSRRYARIAAGAGLALFFAAARTLRADDVSLFYLYSNAVEYEGSGYRQTREGWELKVKPHGAGLGLRWRHPWTEDWSMNWQYWQNFAYYSWEDGNSVSPTLRQTGQTKLGVHELMGDARHPLEGSSVQALAGLEGVYESYRRKDIVFNQVSDPSSVQEGLSALGAYIGFAREPKPDPARRFYWDGEISIGHLFFTRDVQSIEGGSIHRDGYTYHFRVEGGFRRENWRAGLGFVRHMIEITVPGGKALPTGAAASLPINKIDFGSPYLVLTFLF